MRVLKNSTLCSYHSHKDPCSSDSIERNSSGAVCRKAYEALCRQSLNALARIWDVPSNKEPVPDDFRLSCAPRAIWKRRSEDPDYVANTYSKNACLTPICTLSTDIGMSSENYQELNQGTAHGSIEMLSEYGPRVQHVVNAFVAGMSLSY